MKSKAIILIGCCLLLTSCIVKSIRPFYISDATEYQEYLVGTWTDNKKNTWEVASFRDLMEKDKKDGIKLSTEDKAAFEKYKDGYIISYIKKDKKSEFVAMPFKVDNQLFIDFIPFDFEEISNDLLSQHLLKTHSVAKVDRQEDNTVKIIWLDEGRIKDLFKKDQLKLKHEKVGLDESFVLTATSEELYKFLKKYNSSTIKNKWETSEKFTLTRIDAQP